MQTFTYGKRTTFSIIKELVRDSKLTKKINKSTTDSVGKLCHVMIVCPITHVMLVVDHYLLNSGSTIEKFSITNLDLPHLSR